MFQRLLDEDKDDHDLKFAVAAISVQLKDYAYAERLFLELKASGSGDLGSVAFYRGQIAEATNRYDDAIARYGEVTEGDRAWTAKLRVAAVIAKKVIQRVPVATSHRSSRKGAISKSNVHRPTLRCCATRATSRVPTAS